MIRRIVLFVVQTLATLMLAVAVLTGLAVWRVASGPIAVDQVTPYLARALDDAAGAAGNLRTEVAGTVLSWGGFGHPLELRLRQVKVGTVGGREIAQVPELAVGVSLRALIQGRLALSRLGVIGATLHLERTADGRVRLDLDGAGPTADLPAPLPDHAGAADQPSPLAALVAALHQPAGQDGPLAALTQLSIVNASLTLADHVSGVTWTLPLANLTARRGAEGLRAQASLEVPAPGHPGTLEIAASEQSGDGSILASLKLRDVDGGALATVVPALAPFTGSRLPLSGSVEAVLGGDLRPVRLLVALSGAGPGRIEAPALLPAPVDIGALALTAAIDPATGGFALEHAQLSLTAPDLTITAAGRGKNHGGRICFTLTAGKHIGRIETTLTPDAAGSELALTVTGLEPAAFAGLGETLAPLAAAAVPLSGTLRLTLDPAWTPGQLALDLALAPGKLTLPPSQLPAPVTVTGGTVRLSARLAPEHPFTAAPERLDIETIALNFGGPQLSLKGRLSRSGERLAIQGGLRLQRTPAPALDALWPAGVGARAREWVTQNITDGVIDEAWIAVEGSAPLADPSEIVATTLNGGLAGSNLTVNYFKKLPPIIGVSGRGTTDGRALSLVTSGGHILDMPLGEAHIVVSKLDTPQEWMDIDTPLSGSIRSTLRVLDTPPLGYARKVGIDPARTQGSQTAHLHFTFPLKRDITLQDVAIRTRATLHGAGAENVAGGITVTSGELKLDLDNSGMDTTGTAKLEGIPATVHWRENFDDAADPQTRVEVKGELSEDQAVARAPLLLKGRLTGPVGADVALVVNKRRKTTLSGQLSLARAQLAISELNWNKPVGTPGNLRFTLAMDKSKPMRPFQLWWDAAGLKVTGTGFYDIAADGLDRLSLSEVKSGVNDFKLELKARPDRSFEIALAGPSLDARPFLSSPGNEQEKRKLREAFAARRATPAAAGGQTAAPPSGPRYDLTLQTARAVTGEKDHAFTGVWGKLRNNGIGWDTVELNGLVAGSSAGLTLRYLPAGARRWLSVTGGDAGAVLRALDLTDTIRGGPFSITGSGEPGVPTRPVSGKVELGEFRMVGAPLLARLLHALSITGLVELLSGEGLVFSQLAGDVTWSGSTLTLADFRSSGGALGLTADGPIHLAADALDIEGTIVPLYGINRVLGLVPFLGDLLSGGKGQGLFAATYHLTGRASQPDVSVNPLAVLAPGFLRNLFFLD